MVSDSKQTSSNQYRCVLVLVVMDNRDTFSLSRKWLLQKPLAPDSKQSFQISTDHPRLWLSWTTLRRFTIIKWLMQKPLVSHSRQISSNQNEWSQALAAMDNIETFHHQKMVAAEVVGFGFEADFFKSPPMILGFCCHVQS